MVFLLLAYKVSKLDREYQEYNPYEVLSLDPVMNTHKIESLCFLLVLPCSTETVELFIHKI